MAKKAAAYVFAVCKERPDFFGKFVEKGIDFVVVENPMMVDYPADLGVSFNTDFMPKLVPPRYDRSLQVAVPTQNVSYCIMLSEDDPMTQKYLEELGMTPDKAAAG